MALPDARPLRTARALLLLALAACLAAACGGSDEPGQNASPGGAPAAGGQSGKVCISGDTRECTGPGACKGGQACKADGSGFDPCVCAGSGGASGSGNGGSGNGGSGQAGSGTAGSGTAGSGNGGNGGSSGVCIPGKQEVCPCPGGTQGVQACKADGSGFDPCSCSGAGGGGQAGNGTAGSGTAGSGNGGSGQAGSGTAGNGTAGSGTAGSGTAGSGTAGSGNGGSGQAGSGAGGGSTCGNGIKEANELCDAANLGGQSCQGQGFDGGTLSCMNCSFDTSACCDNACPFEGDTQCSGNSQQTCSKGVTGCLAWSPPISCGSSGCAGKVCANQTCGNNTAEGSEPCDGVDLKGQTCKNQGYDGGTLVCSSCSLNKSGCCSNSCSFQGEKQCKGNDVYTCNIGSCLYLAFTQSCPAGCSNGECICQPNCANKCGGADGCGGVCSGSCPEGQTCLLTNTCGCSSSALNGMFTIINANSGPGCTSNAGVPLQAFAQMTSTNDIRFSVTRADNTPFGANATFSVYEGNGPVCPNPPNAVKKTADVVIGLSQQTVNFVLNPYQGPWALNETKQFWIGVDQAGVQSAQATGVISVKRTCVP